MTTSWSERGDAQDDPTRFLMAWLGCDEAQADELWQLTQWLEHERAIATSGYPRDDAPSAPLAERCADAEYVGQLLALARREGCDVSLITRLQGVYDAMRHGLT